MPKFISIIRNIRTDLIICLLLLMLIVIGQFVLYSASSGNINVMSRQGFRVVLACITLVIFAQIPCRIYLSWAPIIFFISTLLLFGVLLIGHTGKGAQRWLNLGFIRFQPSEIMKIACPMIVAYYLSMVTSRLTLVKLLISLLFVFVPALLIAKQPDLGTALLVASSGLIVIFFAGVNWKYLYYAIGLTILSLPIGWHFLHDYQRKRVMNFLFPEMDPLGSGYHIIQSKIAIGSGGIFGKGWMHGTQSHLQFLPERTTDFIFAVFSEEFGFVGIVMLLFIYFILILRCIYILNQTQDSFSRLFAGGLIFTFFIYVFVNISMVSGLLPVVGVPLPLISYGGTSMVTIMIGFGIIISIHNDKVMFD